MSKAVVYGLLTTAFILFVVIAPSNQNGHDNYALARRFGQNRAAFDPLIEEIEMAKEGAIDGHNFLAKLKNIFWARSGEKQDLVSYVKDLNVTMRLTILFPLLDVEPQDGVISFKELEHWNARQASHRLSYTTHKELASHDENKDGSITFKEYFPKFSEEDTENNDMMHGEAEWWKEQFSNADADNNGALSFEEFQDFLHPEDSHSEVIQKWLLTEKMKRMDRDKDGKLDFVEFQNGAYDLYKTYATFENSGVVTRPQEKFAQLDTNNDKHLDEDELKPLLHYLHPGALAYSRFYTSYLIHEADENEDGSLSFHEIINHEHIFYNTVFEGKYEGISSDLHDEL